MTDKSWLFVIDHQPAFSHPASPWFGPHMAAATREIETLVPLFGDRVLFTRFVPPAEITGSWVEYYRKWGSVLGPQNEWLWPVDDPWKGYPSIASHTFSKWIPEARAYFGPEPEVVICGVATDCCVLGTVFAAVDDGARVRLVADTCAAGSVEAHERAVSIMASRAPQLVVTTAAEERARLAVPAE